MPRDPNQLGRLLVDMATGYVPPEPESTKNPAAVALGHLGGLKGGKARAASLTKKQRAEAARLAAGARWKPNLGLRRDKLMEKALPPAIPTRHPYYDDVPQMGAEKTKSQTRRKPTPHSGK
jgi:hypothetical protein